MKIVYPFAFFLFIATSLMAQQFQLHKSEANTNSSFRGLSVVDNNIAWLGGTEGTVGSTKDGGYTWNLRQVEGFETADFRSIYAFDSQHVVIANAGSPAYILVTDDGGNTWKSVYTNSHPNAFFDGIDFWNEKEGIIYGDPINGRMLMLRTRDGGLSWTYISEAPIPEKGEVSFAASGTGIRCSGKNQIIISTGGTVSRLWISKDKGTTWSVINTPIVQGTSTTGVFSFTQNNKTVIIVGGDYKNEELSSRHNFYSNDYGLEWLLPSTPTRGYRECVEYISKKSLIAVGPGGIDISTDNGVNWKPHSDEKGLHVARKARKGSRILIAGKGQVFVLK